MWQQLQLKVHLPTLHLLFTYTFYLLTWFYLLPLFLYAVVKELGNLTVDREIRCLVPLLKNG